MVVCWGGHSINETEYLYRQKVGSQLGLRELNICTGCGLGAIEAPIKGAAVGHAQQRYKEGRFIGMTEPSIIAAEPPNPLVNKLVIMPDIEKRLEAFVRLGHGIIIFPGGVGTAEVALQMKKAMPQVKEHRRHTGDAYSFNWSLRIAPDLQLPFEPTHENMANFNLHPSQAPEALASALRKAFSGIVAGNVKEVGIQAIEEHGPYKIHGDAQLMQSMDKLLQGFVVQQRMKLPGSAYIPCYEICT